MMTLKEKNKLKEILDNLPDDKGREVLDFALFLQKRASDKTGKEKERPLGVFDGEIVIRPSFYDPLPEEILNSFYIERES